MHYLKQMTLLLKQIDFVTLHTFKQKLTVWKTKGRENTVEVQTWPISNLFFSNLGYSRIFN